MKQYINKNTRAKCKAIQYMGKELTEISDYLHNLGYSSAYGGSEDGDWHLVNKDTTLRPEIKFCHSDWFVIITDRDFRILSDDKFHDEYFDESENIITNISGIMSEEESSEESPMTFKIPDGYEIDTEKSTPKEIILKKKSISFEDIWNQHMETISGDLMIHEFKTTEEIIIKLDTYYGMLLVARYLNGGWQPKPNDLKHYFILSGDNVVITASKYYTGHICFKSYGTALQAQEIIGVDTIKKLLINNF